MGVRGLVDNHVVEHCHHTFSLPPRTGLTAVPPNHHAPASGGCQRPAGAALGVCRPGVAWGRLDSGCRSPVCGETSEVCGGGRMLRPTSMPKPAGAIACEAGLGSCSRRRGGSTDCCSHGSSGLSISMRSSGYKIFGVSLDEKGRRHGASRSGCTMRGSAFVAPA